MLTELPFLWAVDYFGSKTNSMHKGTAVHLWVKGFPYQLCHSAKPKSIWFPWFLSTTEATLRAGSTLCHHVAQQSTAATLEPALAGGQSSGVLVPTLQQSNPLGLILANVIAGNRSLLLAYPAPGYTEKQKGTHALRPTGEMSQCDGSLTLPWSSSWKKRRRSWRKDLHGSQHREARGLSCQSWMAWKHCKEKNWHIHKNLHRNLQKVVHELRKRHTGSKCFKRLDTFSKPTFDTNKSLFPVPANLHLPIGAEVHLKNKWHGSTSNHM